MCIGFALVDDVLLPTHQVAYERSQKEYDVLEARFKKLQIDFEQQLIACEQLNNENQTKASELKV